MSRYKEWNRAYNGIINMHEKEGIKTNKHDSKVELKNINDFAKKEGFEGSNTDKILYASEKFQSFKDHVKNKQQ